MKIALEYMSGLVLVVLVSFAVIMSSKSLADEPTQLIEEVVVIGMVYSDIELPPIDIPSDAVIEDIPTEYDKIAQK